MKSISFLMLFFVLVSGCKKEHADIPDQTLLNELKLNQLQIIASHNSYHKHMNDALFNFLKGIDFILPSQYKIAELDYAHESFYDQLDLYNVRGLEIDIYADPSGGHFFHRAGNSLIQKPTASGIDELKKPGFKVLHIPDIDF